MSRVLLFAMVLSLLAPVANAGFVARKPGTRDPRRSETVTRKARRSHFRESRVRFRPLGPGANSSLRKRQRRQVDHLGSQRRGEFVGSLRDAGVTVLPAKYAKLVYTLYGSSAFPGADAHATYHPSGVGLARELHGVANSLVAKRRQGEPVDRARIRELRELAALAEQASGSVAIVGRKPSAVRAAMVQHAVRGAQALGPAGFVRVRPRLKGALDYAQSSTASALPLGERRAVLRETMSIAREYARHVRSAGGSVNSPALAFALSQRFPDYFDRTATEVSLPQLERALRRTLKAD